jgi:hemolysin III
MFSASAVYHMANAKPVVLQMLKKIDHFAIFLLIAGSNTPFCLPAFTGFWYCGLLTLIW